MLKLTAAVVFVGLLACSAPPSPAIPAGHDPNLWRRAWQLHHEAIVADTHSDTTSRILDDDFDMGVRSKDGHMDLPRIAEGGLDVQFYSIYVSARYFGDEDMSSAETLGTSKPNASARRAFDMMDGFFRTVDRCGDRMRACFSVADIHKAVALGKHAALMGIEGGHAIEGDLKLLRVFARLGVRYMTLTHTNHNHFADSCAQSSPKWRGLNRLGVKVVREMNRLGMMVDVSHVSDATFYHTLEVTRAPVILSHSSVRKLCDHPRNIDDDMLRALRRNRGVIMINFNCGFLDREYGLRRMSRTQKVAVRRRALEQRYPERGPEFEVALAEVITAFPTPERPDISVLIDHIMHAIAIAGADHVGLGSDYDGVPCVPKGVDDVSFLPRITYHLLKRGVSEATIRKVLGGNLLRVFAEVEQVRDTLRGETPHRNDPKTDRIVIKN